MSRRANSLRYNPALALDANPRHRRTLFIHSYLAGFTALQILYLALDDLQFNLILSLGYTCGFLYSYSIATRWRPMTTYAVSLLSIIAAVLYAQQWTADMSAYGNVLGSLGGVLMVLLSFQAFSTNSHRFILMFCVVFLLFGAVASYDLKFMLLLPLFLGFAGCALYIANQVDIHSRVAAEQDSKMPPGGGISRRFVFVLLRVIAVVIALSVFAYIMAPHSSATPRSLLLSKSSIVEEVQEQDQQQPEGTQDDQQSSTGIGEDFDMSGGGELSSDPLPVIKLKSHRAVYLRAKVYDQFTGGGWEQSMLLLPDGRRPGRLIDLQGFQDYMASGGGYVVPLVDFPSATTFMSLGKTAGVRLAERNIFSDSNFPNLTYDLVQQQITFLEDLDPLYVAAYQPVRITNLSRTSSGRMLNIPHVDRASTLRPIELDRKLPKDFTYTVHSLEPKAGPRQLDEVYASGPDEIVKHYTWLPLENEAWQGRAAELGLDPTVIRPVSQRLVNFALTKFGGPDLVNGREVYPSVLDKARRINDWLVNSGEFEYTREHPPLPAGREVTEAFCFETKSGWCRYFASTMAVMARINGIPSRIVSGYAPGSYSLADNAYIYRASNAHAWVELYFDGYGWIMFDPTPASRSSLGTTDSTNWLVEVVDFLQDLFVIDPAGTQRTILEGLRAAWEFILTNIRPVSAGLLLSAALFAVAYALRRRRHRRKRRLIEPRNAAVALYLRLQGMLQRLGFILETGDTARQVCAAAVAQFPQLQPGLTRFLPLYESAAFADADFTPQQASEVAQLQAELEGLVNAELEARQRERRRK